jgi:hypothetical protein
MSTRATYTFLTTADDHKPSVTFYIHHDGYPEGAAQYLAAACTFENERGSLAENFLRANDRAEFTGSHETHGDTEYRYTVRLYAVVVEARKFYGEESWSVIYTGPLADFIAANGGPELMQYQGRYMTLEQAKETLVAMLAQTNHAIQKGGTANAAGSANDAWRLRNVILAKFGADDFITEAEKAIEACDRYCSIAYGWADGKTTELAYQNWYTAFRAAA